MLSLKWTQINRQPFIEPLVRLTQVPGLEEKTAYRVGRIWAACRDVLQKCADSEKKMIIANEYFDKDTEGKMIMREGDPDMPKIKADCEKQSFEAFGKIVEGHTCNIKVLPLDIANLGPAKLNPSQLLALEPILTGFPEDESGEFESVATETTK